MKKFNKFCRQYHVADPFPVTEYLLCCFAAYMAEEGLAPQTGKSYMAAVRNVQLSLGLPDPQEKSSLPVLRRVQAGISRLRLSRGTPTRNRLPITAHLLRQLRSTWERTSHPNRVLLWAVSCTAFFGFFRLGELLRDSPRTFNQSIHLAWGDVAADSRTDPTMVQIVLKRSKTDQFGKGANMIIGRTGLDVCPVAAVLNYIVLRGSAPGPFFTTPDGQALAKQVFVAEVRKVLVAKGLPADQYAGHSFRIGAATSAALAGVEDSTIQLLGRWQSAAFLRYIRTPHERLAALSGTLATHGLSQRENTATSRGE